MAGGKGGDWQAAMPFNPCPPKGGAPALAAGRQGLAVAQNFGSFLTVSGDHWTAIANTPLRAKRRSTAEAEPTQMRHEGMCSGGLVHGAGDGSIQWMVIQIQIQKRLKEVNISLYNLIQYISNN